MKRVKDYSLQAGAPPRSPLLRPLAGQLLTLLARWNRRALGTSVLLVCFLLFAIRHLSYSTFTSFVTRRHPLSRLMDKAAKAQRREVSQWQSRGRNSKGTGLSITAARKEYTREHGQEPPKGWNEWFTHYQRSEGMAMRCTGDSYREMYQSLKIWKGVEGGAIQKMMDTTTAQAVQGLGRVSVRDGAVVNWATMDFGEQGKDSSTRAVVEQMLRNLVNTTGIVLPDGMSISLFPSLSWRLTIVRSLCSPFPLSQLTWSLMA